MSPFHSLSALARSFFAIWALLLCLINIVNALLSAGRKRKLVFSLALLLFALAYFRWQVIFDLSLSERGLAEIVTGSYKLCSLSYVVWLAWFLVLSAATVLLFVYNVRFAKKHVTPGAIKIYLDKMPCGVCCWRENGRVLFSNVCMNRLCVRLTGAPLMNGNQFYEAVAEGICEADGKIWRFSRRETELGGETVSEMIASDVTVEYAETQALERDKTELSRLNRELKEYTIGIDETVRRQEILQAKIDIHDEMNKLMLSTMAAENGENEELDRIFSLWERNALLLCMEGEEKGDLKAADRLEKLAEALKIRLIREGEIPRALSEKQRALFFSAAQEALANAAKHAAAKTMTISFEEKASRVYCRFANDGNIPEKAPSFTGGLANLSRLTAMQNATVHAEAGERFVLTIGFSIENEPNDGCAR